jgi:UDP-glucose 4-epimerase
MNILVTGGAGFIASHVADAFINSGHEVTVLDDMSTGKRENLHAKATLVEGDIRSEAAFELVKCGNFDVIDHHAAHIHVGRSVENPKHDADVNIMGTLNLMAAAKESGTVKHILFASTGGAMYGNKQTPFDESMPPQPLSPYGISKRAVELYLYFYQEQYGIPFTSLRYANVYGPRQNPFGEAGVISIFLDKLKAHEQPVINGDGNQTRDYVYVEDVAKANVAALEKRVSGEFNIGTTIETDVNQIYEMVRKAAGVDIQAEHGPERPGEQRTSSLRYGKAREVLGWEPVVSLETGIMKTADYFLR